MLKPLEWDNLNPDRLINQEINNKRRTSIFDLEIKKKSGSSIIPDIHHSKVKMWVKMGQDGSRWVKIGQGY